MDCRIEVESLFLFIPSPGVNKSHKVLIRVFLSLTLTKTIYLFIRGRFGSDRWKINASGRFSLNLVEPLSSDCYGIHGHSFVQW